MGVIRECGGKMFMREHKWKEAETEFFEAFRNYDEAGCPQKLQCLKYMNSWLSHSSRYLVLANMLSLQAEQIDLFDAPEVKPFVQF